MRTCGPGDKFNVKVQSEAFVEFQAVITYPRHMDFVIAFRMHLAGALGIRAASFERAQRDPEAYRLYLKGRFAPLAPNR
jgi:hypothetical protein